LYLLLDWASYVQAVRHTSITPWNPTTGLVMALLLVRGSRWAPLVALGIFVGELLTDDAPAPWRVLAVASGYLALVYTLAAWGLRRRGLDRPIGTPKAAARDVRLFYPLFAPVTWVALRHGVPGAMISVSLVQAALVAALALTPGSITLFDVQFPLLSLGITALFLGALATERDTTLRQLRQQDAALQRSMRFAVAGELASVLTHELNQPMTALG